MTYSKKASQVFREEKHTSPFSNVTTFKNAFPEIEHLEVKVYEENFAQSLDNRYKSGTFTYNETNSSEYHDCHNPQCYNGGISIGDLLRSLTSSLQTEGESEAMCQGYEGSLNGRKEYRSCLHHFKVTVNITYKDNKNNS